MANGSANTHDCLDPVEGIVGGPNELRLLILLISKFDAESHDRKHVKYCCRVRIKHEQYKAGMTINHVKSGD
jgi:hypothetical protein